MKKDFLKLFVFVPILFVSCTKNDEVTQPTTQTKNSKDLSKASGFRFENGRLIKGNVTSITNEQGEWVAGLTYPTVASFSEMFSSTKTTLEQIQTNNDYAAADAYEMEMADKVAGYFYYIRGIDIRSDFINDPHGVIVLGLFYAADEYHQLHPSANMATQKTTKKPITYIYSDDDALSCFITAVSSVIGLSNAKQIWKSIIAGATEQTIIGMIKFAARKAAIGWTIVTSVYQVGDCLDWW